MDNDLGLARHDRWHLALHNLVARTGFDGLRPVALRRDGEAFVLPTTGHSLRVPSALLWRSDRRGWAARLARLSVEFGIDGPFRLSPGDQVIDIGANVGDFTLAALAQGARVLCIDGDPAVVACLRRNVAGRDGVAIETAILWKEACELTFYSAPGRADSSIFLPPGDGVSSFTAQATTLDAIAARHDLGPVALLKMDAEGAEPEVLQGAAQVLARTRNVAIDTGPERNGQETGEACAEILRAHGFTILPPPPARRRMTFATRAD